MIPTTEILAACIRRHRQLRAGQGKAPLSDRWYLDAYGIDMSMLSAAMALADTTTHPGSVAAALRASFSTGPSSSPYSERR